MFVALLMVGCGEEAQKKAVQEEIKDVLHTQYYENGQKEREGNWKDGKLMSIVIWKPNGEKCPVTNVVNGNGVWVEYKEDGTEDDRFTFKAGEPVRD